MKKLLCSLLAFCLLSVLSFSLPAAGESASSQTEPPATEYAVSGVNLFITIPDTYKVLTRDFEDNDPFLTDNQIDPDALRETFEQGEIYLNALSTLDYQKEVAISWQPHEETKDIQSLKTLSELELSTIEKTLDEPIIQNSVTLTYDSHTREEINGILFFRAIGKSTDSTDSADSVCNLIQYYTVLEGKALNITYNSYDGPIDAQTAAEFDSIVKTIRFTDAATISAAQQEQENTAFPFYWILIFVFLFILLVGAVVFLWHHKKKSFKKYRYAEDPFDYKPPYEEQ